MLSDLFKWLGALPPSSASFLGTLTGSGLGLIALLSGALFNAHLNRKRDDRLRGDETRAVISALKAELLGITDTLIRNADSLDAPRGDFVAPDLAHSVRVMPVLLQRFGLLGAETARDVIDIYILIDQYCEALLLGGGTLSGDSRPDRRLIKMPFSCASFVASLNRDMAQKIRGTIEKLDAFL